MRKILMILICGVLALGMSGCGDKNTGGSDNKKLDSTAKGEKVGITISEVVSSFENGYAVVKGTDGESYVIDENGNSNYKLESDKFKFVNGYILSPEGRNYVMDGSGKKVFEKKDNRYYESVSKSGNVVIKEIEDSLAGVDSKYKIIDKKDNTIYTNDEYDYEFIDGDVYKFGRTLINAKTGKAYTFSDSVGDAEIFNGYLYFKGERDKKYIISDDLEKVYTITNDFDLLGVINDKYIYAEDEESDDDTYGIYDMNGTLVKDLTEGGIKYVFEYDNVYYVESKTGYIYTLDSKFNYITKPIKGHGRILPSSIGVLGFKDGKVYLLDKSLEFKKELSFISNFKSVDIDNDFMNFNDKFLYGDDGIVYNLETKKLLQIYK